MVDDPFWKGLVTPLPAPAHADERGVLTSVAFAPHDFRVVRAFTVVAPDGAVRGGHGHHRGRQILLRVGGEIHVEVRRDGRVLELSLGPDVPGLLIESGVWARQTYSGPDAALVVFCDTEYDVDDYFSGPEASS
ncbi:MAG TPA: WxcM-like domain-containing protein [Dermatophilaceae bacterium]|nr:WxcM-like domain-containing protein [Dermatophilaceae bacterium]